MPEVFRNLPEGYTSQTTPISPRSSNPPEHAPTFIPTSLDLAQQFNTLCQELDSLTWPSASAEAANEYKRVHAQKLNRLEYLIACMPGTSFLQDYLTEEVMRIGNGQSSLQFSAVLELSGIDPDNFQAGAFTKEGAQKVEERQLKTFLASDIKAARRAGELRRASQLTELHNTWLDAYREHYDVPPSRIDSLRVPAQTPLQHDVIFYRGPTAASPVPARLL